MSMTCEKCGSEIVEGAAFCFNCGAPVPKAEPQPKETQPVPSADVFNEQPQATNYGDLFQQEAPKKNDPAPQQGYAEWRQPQPVYQQAPAYQQPAPQPYYGQQNMNQGYGAPAYNAPQNMNPAYGAPRYNAPQNMNPGFGYAQPYTPPVQPAVKKKSKTPAVVISIISLLLVAAVVIVVVLPLAFHIDLLGLHLFDNNPKGVTERALKACFVDMNVRQTMDTVYEQKYSQDKMTDEEINSTQAMMDQYKAMLQSSNVKLTYKILDSYKVDDTKYYDYIDRMKADGTDTSKIQDMVEVDYTLSGGGKTSRNMTMMCIKAEGKWYVSAYSYQEMASVGF